MKSSKTLMNMPKLARPAAAACAVSTHHKIGGSTALAASPLFLTDTNAPFDWSEIQFILSGPINGLFERMFETEAGPLFLNGVFLLTLMRMGVYLDSCSLPTCGTSRSAMDNRGLLDIIFME